MPIPRGVGRAQLILAIALIALAGLVWSSSTTGTVAQEATPTFDPASFQVELELVVDGLDQPVFVADPADGSGRLFVVEQSGRIRIVREGAVEPEPFLDLTGLVTTRGSEQGLLSMAFHPDFAENGRFFVGYTANQGEGSGDNTIARLTVSADPDRADPDSLEVLLAVPDPFQNHNGGLVMFGPDGYLYAGLGDGGAGGDPLDNGQNPQVLLGKILRLDVDQAGEGLPYGIPADNPFADGSAGRPEVWAFGLRNPWRFSFDRATGDLYIADVGQNQIEEVNMQPAASAGGENYGWNVMEGTDCFLEEDCDAASFVPPVAEYTHDLGCSVTGGYVYRGPAAPSLQGVYLFTDYCTGLLWGLGRDDSGAWTLSDPIATDLRISSFSETADGDLFVLDLDGAIYRITGE